MGTLTNTEMTATATSPTSKETVMTRLSTSHIKLTEKSLALFLKFAGDAGNWNGTPLVSLNAAERGNLVQLKKAGLVTTFQSDEQRRPASGTYWPG